MAQTDLAIRIATVMDATGLKKADKGIGGLTKSAAKLGKVLGLALGTAAIVAFGKASVKAFIDDEKSAVLLANAVKNLGLQMEQPAIDAYIANLEKSTSIADDELRPAFTSLLQTTKDLAGAQQLLGLATDISRGSSVDLATVTADLNKAYTGNMKGLKKYNLGLTNAELATKSFSEITALLNAQFKGSNAAYLKSYAGQLETLKLAAGNAQEIIGKGLVDSLIALTGSLDITDMSNKIVGFATFLADVFVKLGNLIGKNIAFVKNLGIAIVAVFAASKVYAGAVAFMAIITKITKAYKLMREVSIGAAIASMAAINPVAALVGGAALVATIIAATKLIDKITTKGGVEVIKPPDFSGLDDPKYKKAVADQIKAEKLKAANIKKDLAARKALSIFDLDAIQLQAALKGQISDDERKRLELQIAILTGAEGEAKKLTGELAKSQGLTAQLTAWLQNIPTASNPFMAWKGYLDEIELQAKRIAAAGQGTAATAAAPPKNPLIPSLVPNLVPPSLPADLIAATLESLGIASIYDAPMSPLAGYTDAQAELLDALKSFLSADAAATKIDVYLDGQVVGGAISNSQTNANLSGSFTTVGGRGGGGGRFATQML